METLKEECKGSHIPARVLTPVKPHCILGISREKNTCTSVIL